MATIRETHTWSKTNPAPGERVRVITDGTAGHGSWHAESEGTYQGVRPSEWTGEPMHMFTDGVINGVPQAIFGFPVAEVRRYDGHDAPAGAGDDVEAYRG